MQIGRLPRYFSIMLRCIFTMLIIVFSWHQLSFVVFQVARIVHYHHVRNTDPIYKNKLRDTICLSKNDLKEITWVEDDEIRFNGKMFDVKRQIQQGNNILLVGHYDSKDDMLLAATFSFFDERQGTGQTKNNSIKLLFFDAVLDTAGYQQPFQAMLIAEQPQYFFISFCQSVYIGNTSPPPESLSV